MVESTNKKRKFAPDGHAALVKQESLSEMLQQLEAEEDVAGGKQCHKMSSHQPSTPVVELNMHPDCSIYRNLCGMVSASYTEAKCQDRFYR